MRHPEPTAPQLQAVRNRRPAGRVRNYICRPARLDRNAQASVKRRYEPEDGDDHEGFSDPLGLLWVVDRIASGDHLERDRRVREFHKRLRVPFFVRKERHS